MKPRNVVITMEVLTNVKLKDIRKHDNWLYADKGELVTGSSLMKIKQIQANVIRRNA